MLNSTPEQLARIFCLADLAFALVHRDTARWNSASEEERQEVRGSLGKEIRLPTDRQMQIATVRDRAAVLVNLQEARALAKRLGRKRVTARIATKSPEKL